MSGLDDMELPAGWARVSLGELGAEAQPGFASGRHNQDGKGVLHLRPMNVTRQGVLDTSDARYVSDESDRRVKPGDILFNNTNSPALVGKTALMRLQQPVAYSNHMTRLRTPSGVDPAFLALQLHWLWMSGYFQSILSNHVNQASVATKKLLETVVFIPPPEEQRCIVEALEDHLSRLDAAEQLIARGVPRTRRLQESVSSITYGYSVPGDEPSAPPPAPSGTDDGPLPNLPPSWSWKRLEEIADVVGGVTKDKKKQSNPDLPEIPYLRVANVQRGWLDLSEVSVIRVPETKARQLALQHGDVLLNEGGDRDKLGRGWIWENQLPITIHQNHVFRARIHNDAIHPKLLSWYANSSARWFETNGKQSVNLASISLSKIRKLPIPIPPLDEQKKILERIEKQISVIDTATSLSEQALTKAKALRRALFARAFTGKLVPQDATDESASVLLDRIRAERVAQGGKGTAKRPPRRSRKTATTPAADMPPPPPPAATPAPTDAVQQELPL